MLHGFSDRSLDRAIAEGRLRAAKVLGAWRITREDGDRFARGLASAARSCAGADHPPDFWARSVAVSA